MPWGRASSPLEATPRREWSTMDESSQRVSWLLPPGRVATIAIAYESVRPAKGVYFVDRRHVVWTQGETQDTRYWVPTYDDAKLTI